MNARQPACLRSCKESLYALWCYLQQREMWVLQLVQAPELMAWEGTLNPVGQESKGVTDTTALYSDPCYMPCPII